MCLASRSRAPHAMAYWSRPVRTDVCSLLARMPRYTPAPLGIRSTARMRATGRNGSFRHVLALSDSSSTRIIKQISGLLIRGFGVQVPGGAPVLTWGFINPRLSLCVRVVPISFPCSLRACSAVGWWTYCGLSKTGSARPPRATACWSAATSRPASWFSGAAPGRPSPGAVGRRRTHPPHGPRDPAPACRSAQQTLGRKIGYADFANQTAYLTPKGAIALWKEGDDRLYVYQDYDEFAADEHPKALVAEVAGSLGRRYVLELDI